MSSNDRAVAIDGATADASWPDARRAWYTVALLGLLYIISWIDRNILALLAQPVAQDLGLDDRQLALLLGLGFALLYAVGGVVLAHFVDTRNRRIVATAGVVLWSVTTMLSAFATDFWTLLVLRSGVALGEAVLMPAAISLIADLFPPKRRGLPVAAFTSIGGFMTMGSYAGGAAAISLAGPVSGGIGLSVWQTTFIIVGLPGLIVALIFAISATVPERRSSGSESASDISMKAVVVHLRRRAAFLAPLLSMTGINCLFTLSTIIWLPTVLIRQHQVTESYAGYMIGLVGVPMGLLGNFFWQWVAGRLQHRNPTKGILQTFVAPALLGAPFFLAALLIDNIQVQLAGFAFGLFIVTAFNVLTPLAVQLFIPARMQGRIISLNFLIIAALGYGIGPLAGAELGTLLWDGSQSLRYGLATLTLISWPLLVITTVLTLRNCDDQIE